MKLLACDFVRSAVGPCVAEVLGGDIGLEVDPARCISGVSGEIQAAGNMRRLRDLARRLWEDVYLARDRFPP